MIVWNQNFHKNFQKNDVTLKILRLDIIKSWSFFVIVRWRSKTLQIKVTYLWQFVTICDNLLQYGLHCNCYCFSSWLSTAARLGTLLASRVSSNNRLGFVDDADAPSGEKKLRKDDNFHLKFGFFGDCWLFSLLKAVESDGRLLCVFVSLLGCSHDLIQLTFFDLKFTFWRVIFFCISWLWWMGQKNYKRLS